MAEITKNSILAVIEEVTEGVPILPTAATDFVALQDGFAAEPGFTSLENAELKPSIGSSKPIAGLETPTFSMSHYLRHSGVAGTAPQYKKLLKALFGSETAIATEHTVAAASTVSVVNVAGGTGASHPRGSALLLKHAASAWEIRSVKTRSTDALTLGFDALVAPASGIGVGKPVTYFPENTAHPSLTLALYRGNGGALEVLSGMRVTEGTIEIAAGELINTSFSLEGVKYSFDPIEVTASTDTLDFTDSAAAAKVATVTAKLYRTPHELADSLMTAMNAAGGADTYTVIYNDRGALAGKFTISSSATPFTLRFATGANTAQTIASKVGFAVADETGAQSYNSDVVQSWGAAYSPTYDSADPISAKYLELLIGDQQDTTCVCASTVSIAIANTRTPIPCICAETGQQGSVISARETTAEVTLLLEKHDAERFENMRQNDTVGLQFSFGTKTGGNWDAGKSGAIYIPAAVITNHVVDDADGLVVINLSLKGHVDSSGNPEVYMSFV